MDIKTFVIHHLVKGEDLNHHRTLFAGRGAEWVVEAGFIAAASLLPPANVVCVKVHGMLFRRPVRPGEIIRFESKVVLTGRTRLVSYVRAMVGEEMAVDSFITFVYVDEHGKPQPHGLEMVAETPEDQALQQQALELQ